MVEMLAVSEGLQNVYTPLPFKIHLIFCIIATAVYIAQYVRKHAPHYLLIMLAVDATFVTQFCKGNIVITMLFILEICLLTAAGLLSHKYTKAMRQKEKTAEAEK